MDLVRASGTHQIHPRALAGSRPLCRVIGGLTLLKSPYRLSLNDPDGSVAPPPRTKPTAFTPLRRLNPSPPRPLWGERVQGEGSVAVVVWTSGLEAVGGEFNCSQFAVRRLRLFGG